MLFKNLIEKSIRTNAYTDWRNILQAFVYAVIAFIVAYYFKGSTQSTNDDHDINNINPNGY